MSFQSLKLPPWARALAGYALFAILIYLRRPDEFAHPYVWQEDAANIGGFIEHGLVSFLTPVAGYRFLIGKLITFISLKLSFIHYPLIANIISTLFDALVLLSVWLCPTHLRARFFCALAVALAPTTPEVFVLPLYAFWFAGLWLVLALLWRGERLQWLRCLMIGLAGLSSPLIVPIAPLMVARTALERGRGWVASLVAVACMAVQVWTLLSTATLTHLTPFKQLLSIQELGLDVGKFFGEFFTIDPARQLIWLLASLVVFWGFVIINAKRLGPTVWTLLVLYAITIGLGLMRVPASAIGPYEGAPRYFFYPFVCLAWVMIIIAATMKGTPRFVVTTVLLIIAASAATRFQYRSLPMNWRKAVVACSTSQEAYHLIPIRLIGELQPLWTLQVRPEDCRRLRRQSIIPDKL